MNSLVRAIPPVAVFLVAVIVWHWIVVAFQVPQIILPKPMNVLAAIQKERTVLIRAVVATGSAALLGFVVSIVVGTLIAIVFSLSAKLRVALFPYVIFLQTVPIVAIAPLLIIWSGNNFRTIVLIVMIISLFPIVANVTSGLMSVDRNLNDMFRLYSAGKRMTLTKLRIPSAIPHLVLGMRISCGLAVIGAIVGEYFVSNGTTFEGLGSVMNKWQGRLQTDALIGAVAISTLLGVAFFGAVNLLSQTALRRWTLSAGFESDR